jgi:hypothetical protein
MKRGGTVAQFSSIARIDFINLDWPVIANRKWRPGASPPPDSPRGEDRAARGLADRGRVKEIQNGLRERILFRAVERLHSEPGDFVGLQIAGLRKIAPRFLQTALARANENRSRRTRCQNWGRWRSLSGRWSPPLESAGRYRAPLQVSAATGYPAEKAAALPQTPPPRFPRAHAANVGSAPQSCGPSGVSQIIKQVGIVFFVRQTALRKLLRFENTVCFATRRGLSPRNIRRAFATRRARSSRRPRRHEPPHPSSPSLVPGSFRSRAGAPGGTGEDSKQKCGHEGVGRNVKVKIHHGMAKQRR